MADPFQPRFVDLVRNTTATQGTGNIVLGAAVTGFTSFATAVLPGERFYYSVTGTDKPAEREVGRGTMQADGTISREPISGVLTNFTAGSKSIALIAAAEWYNLVQAGSGAGAPPGTTTAASRAAMAAIPAPANGAACILTEGGRSGLFLFSSANRSSDVAADSLQGIYVAPSAAPTGAAGAWVRQGLTLTPHMFGGVESTKSGNRLTGSPAYSESVTDATAAVQAVFDMVKHETGKAWEADFSGFWGLSDPDNDGYCIIIDQPYWLVRRFVMGHFATVGGASGTAVFKLSGGCFNHRAEGRWEIWGAPNMGSDAYVNRPFKHGIEARTASLWDIESLYVRGFKKWGVYFPGSPVDAVYNQNIGTRFGRLKATNCGSVPSAATSRFSSTFSGGTRTGAANDDAQRSVVTLDTAGAAAAHFEANDWVVINGEPYEVMSVNTTANSLSIHPWLPTGSQVSGTLYGLFGGGLHVRGSDTATIKVEMLDTIACGFGFYSAGLYGMSVHCAMCQSGGAAMGLGGAGGNTLGNTVLQAHWEGNQFDLVTRNASGTQAYICGVQAIAGDDIDSPFKNCRSIAANDGTALRRDQAFPSVTFNINGVDYHSADGQTKSRSFAPLISNDPRSNRIIKVADSYSATIKYHEPVDQFFRFAFKAELEITGTAGGAPTGAITISLDPADAAAGITIAGGSAPYVVAAGEATGPVHLAFLLDTSGPARNWIVVRKSGFAAAGGGGGGGGDATFDDLAAASLAVSGLATIGSPTNRIQLLESSTNLYLQAGVVGATATNGQFFFSGINGHDLSGFNVNADQHVFNAGGSLRFYVTSAGAYAAGTLSASGNVTGANLSGTNTGDQTSIAGITGTLAQFNSALTDADFATGGGTATGTNSGDQFTSMTSSRLIGRVTAGFGAAEELTGAQATALLSPVVAGGAQGVMTGADKTKLDAISGTNSGDQTITLTGDVTGSGTGSFAATIGAGKVTYAKIQNVSAASLLLGRATTGAGVVEEISLANGLAMSGTALGLGAITPSSLVTAGAITSSGTAGNGYSTGAGGAVTQATSKSTGVTLNKICGRVTMHAASLAAATSVSFTLTNSTIAATDVVVVNIASGGTTNAYLATVDAVAAGSCRIHLRNMSAAALAEALVLNFAITKSVIA